MEQVPNGEDNTNYIQDRRSNRFKFDKSINIPGVISSILLLWTLISGMGKLITEFQRSARKTDIMWSHFVREHKDLTIDELSTVGEGERR